jgi:hypothetical protein
VDYTPLKGRWATLFFIAVIAFGATFLSLRVESNLGNGGAIASASSAQSDDGGNTSSSQIIVVNPDGSPRQPPAAASPGKDDQPELDIGADAAPPDEIEEQSLNDAEEDWAAKDLPAQSPSGTRIE